MTLLNAVGMQKADPPFQLEHSEAINLIFLGAAIRKYLARVHETILGISTLLCENKSSFPYIFYLKMNQISILHFKCYLKGISEKVKIFTAMSFYCFNEFLTFYSLILKFVVSFESEFTIPLNH